MSFKSVIMPMIVLALLALVLPVVGVHGSAVVVCALVVAAWAWVTGRITAGVGKWCFNQQLGCFGLGLTLATTFVFGFVGTMVVLGVLSDAYKSAIVWTPEGAPVAISLAVCVGSLIIRIVVGALMPDDEQHTKSR